MDRAATAPPHIAALSVSAWSDPEAHDALAVFAAGAGAGKPQHAIALPLPLLGGTSRAEFWLGGAARRVTEDGLRVAHDGDVLMGNIRVPDQGPDAAEAAALGYARLERVTRELGYAHLLRVWNYFGGINVGSDDTERYRRFCVGRARVIPAEPAGGYAAATAIGIPGGPGELHLHWLAARRPGVAIENPRQVSAWEYPREYGPVAPGFSRAMLLEWCEPNLLLISGTASVLGHASAHGDTLAQLDETLVNLTALVERAAAREGTQSRFGDGALLRVYLRHPGDADAVRQRLRQRLGPDTPCMLLHGDICRRELLVEIEAVQPL